jgi:hypothetical protein
VLGKRDLHHETREGIDLLFKPVFGRICSREAKTKFRQCDWSAKKFAAKELDQLLRPIISPEARMDMKADGFWLRGATAFFDVRVTHVNSKCNQGRPTQMIFKEHENEKKRKYQQRVLDVEMGSCFRWNGD